MYFPKNWVVIKFNITAPPSLHSPQVNPEFLAALPPNMQEEVLAQQRLEQQRRTAAQVLLGTTLPC